MPAAGSRLVPIRLARTIRIDALGDGRVRIVGGEPITMLKVKGEAFPETSRHRGMLPRAGQVLTVPAATAEILYARGLAIPFPPPPRTWPDPHWLARTGVVIPCHNDLDGLRGVLAGLEPLIRSGLRVWVVDDGSSTPIAQDIAEGVVIQRNEQAHGPAAARNQGIAAAEAAGCARVVLLDADTVPRRTEWLGLLAVHLERASVAMVAPRIVAAEPGRGGVKGFETAKSALDMGNQSSFVRPRTAVPYVPSAALLLDLRRIHAALGKGPIFSEDMHVAEDVDLCWRLHSTGVEVVYESEARVAHRHRTGLVQLLRRRMFYGEGAARLAESHREAIVPAIFSARTLVAVAGMWWARPWSVALCAALSSWSLVELNGKVGDRRLAVHLLARGVNSAFWQLASAALRPYFPATVLAVTLVSATGRGAHLRRVVTTAAVLEGLRHWLRQRPSNRLPVNRPVSHVLLHRLDDAAYGFGVWRSALRARSLRALIPELRWQ